MTIEPSTCPRAQSDIDFRAPRVGDAAAVWRLAGRCGSLDQNSPYAYLLVCTHFAATSVVAVRDGEVVAFAAAYRPPTEPGALFVWQVAVDEGVRRRGVGRAVLQALLERPASADARHLEATVTPSNQASQRLFRSLASDNRAPCHVSLMFPPSAFPAGRHEAKLLFRIGPLPRRPPHTAAPAAPGGQAPSPLENPP
jgi:L-2,4-diaminobutyric acid acetyltransferase